MVNARLTACHHSIPSIQHPEPSHHPLQLPQLPELLGAHAPSRAAFSAVYSPRLSAALTAFWCLGARGRPAVDLAHCFAPHSGLAALLTRPLGPGLAAGSFSVTENSDRGLRHDGAHRLDRAPDGLRPRLGLEAQEGMKHPGASLSTHV